jgi:hypothetical protein
MNVPFENKVTRYRCRFWNRLWRQPRGFAEPGTARTPADVDENTAHYAAEEQVSAGQ